MHRLIAPSWKSMPFHSQPTTTTHSSHAYVLRFFLWKHEQEGEAPSHQFICHHPIITIQAAMLVPVKHPIRVLNVFPGGDSVENFTRYIDVQFNIFLKREATVGTAPVQCKRKIASHQSYHQKLRGCCSALLQFLSYRQN